MTDPANYVSVGPSVAYFVPPMALADAAKAFQDEGVIDLVLTRRDSYNELCRWSKIGQAFAYALDVASSRGVKQMPHDEGGRMADSELVLLRKWLGERLPYEAGRKRRLYLRPDGVADKRHFGTPDEAIDAALAGRAGAPAAMTSKIAVEKELEQFGMVVANKVYRACAIAEGFYQTPEMYPDWSVDLDGVVREALTTRGARYARESLAIVTSDTLLRAMQDDDNVCALEQTPAPTRDWLLHVVTLRALAGGIGPKSLGNVIISDCLREVADFLTLRGQREEGDLFGALVELKRCYADEPDPRVRIAALARAGAAIDAARPEAPTDD